MPQIELPINQQPHRPSPPHNPLPSSQLAEYSTEPAKPSRSLPNIPNNNNPTAPIQPDTLPNQSHPLPTRDSDARAIILPSSRSVQQGSPTSRPQFRQNREKAGLDWPSRLLTANDLYFCGRGQGKGLGWCGVRGIWGNWIVIGGGNYASAGRQTRYHGD